MQINARIFALAAKYHIEPHDIVRSSVARIKDSFWFYFFRISLVCVIRLFCIFLCYCVCSVMYFIVHAASVRRHNVDISIFDKVAENE